MPADRIARPTAEELLAAVREFLETRVLADAPDEHAFHLRVAINVLGMVERELADAGGAANRYAHELANLGYRDDAELAAAIRSSAVSAEQLPAVIKAVRADVLARLAFADPAHVAQYQREAHT